MLECTTDVQITPRGLTITRHLVDNGATVGWLDVDKADVVNFTQKLADAIEIFSGLENLIIEASQIQTGDTIIGMEVNEIEHKNGLVCVYLEGISALVLAPTRKVQVTRVIE